MGPAVLDPYEEAGRGKDTRMTGRERPAQEGGPYKSSSRKDADLRQPSSERRECGVQGRRKSGTLPAAGGLRERRSAGGRRQMG